MLQIFFVMLFFPVVMNAMQYYIIDSFIKDQKPSDHEPISSEDEDDDRTEDDRPRQSRDTDGALDEGDEEALLTKKDANIKVTDDEAKLKSDATKVDEYDPATDGASSSSSRGGEQDALKLSPKVKDGETGTEAKENKS